jgi:hypothetical protein
MEVRGQQCVPIDLDLLSGRGKPKMSAAGILAIVLLCIAIVVAAAYLLKMLVGKRRRRVDVEVDVEPAEAAEAAAAAVSFIRAPPEQAPAPEPIEVPTQHATAVGAVTTAGPSSKPAAFDMWSAEPAPGTDVDSFGDLVKPEHRLEAEGGATMSVARMMPASWGGGASGAATGVVRATEFDSMWGSLMPAGAMALNPAEMATFGSSLPSWQAQADLVGLSTPVDRNMVLRNNLGIKIGMDQFPWRTKSAFQMGSQLSMFNESSHRADLLAASSLGKAASVMAEFG